MNKEKKDNTLILTLFMTISKVLIKNQSLLQGEMVSE